MVKLHKVHCQLCQFMTGAGDLCLDLADQGITGTVTGSVFAQFGPLFTPNRIRDGRQALTVLIKRDERYFHINLVTLLEMCKAGTDMPNELDPQWDELMKITEAKTWDDFICYVVGDHLDASYGTELKDGEAPAYLVTLSVKGSDTSVRLNLASLIAMARFADLPEPEITCEEIRIAALA